MTNRKLMYLPQMEKLKLICSKHKETYHLDASGIQFVLSINVVHP